MIEISICVSADKAGSGIIKVWLTNLPDVCAQQSNEYVARSCL